MTTTRTRRLLTASVAVLAGAVALTGLATVGQQDAEAAKNIKVASVTTPVKAGKRTVVAIPKVRDAKVGAVRAWVGDSAGASAKVRIRDIKDNKKNWRYAVIVPKSAKRAATKKGMTFSYRVDFKNGRSVWYDKGVSVRR